VVNISPVLNWAEPSGIWSILASEFAAGTSSVGSKRAATEAEPRIGFVALPAKKVQWRPQGFSSGTFDLEQMAQNGEVVFQRHVQPYSPEMDVRCYSKI
jgi:hypothetical protein